MVGGKLVVARAVAAGALAVSFGAGAVAADLSRTPPPPVIAPIYTWNGFYIGGHVGGVSASESATDINGFTATTDPSGAQGGLQAGYNYQIAPNWLVGIEGELSWTSASGGSSAVFHSDHNWYDTVDGRLGYVIPGGWLVYAKGGAAWMNADYSVPGVSVNQTRSGWNIGAGAEFMFAPQWSAKAEYNFLDFGKDSLALPLLGSVDTQVNEFKVGINYHILPGTLFGRW
jgi:outer membrane autotransporter protein